MGGDVFGVPVLVFAIEIRWRWNRNEAPEYRVGVASSGRRANVLVDDAQKMGIMDINADF